MTRSETDLAVARDIAAALPQARDLLDSLVRFGDLADEDDAEEVLNTLIRLLESAAGRLMLRVGLVEEDA